MRLLAGARTLALFLLLFILLAPLGLVLVLRTSVPAANGSLSIAGLSAPVEVVRDGEGVAHIFAHELEDLLCGLGFVHAQDRLWQMELQRRAGQGRLSEIFGEDTFGTDVFLRTLDLYGYAQRSEARLEAPVVRLLAAYAKGVNAFIERPTGLLQARLPPEFLLLGHTPEPWRVADTLVTLKLMALELSANLNHEFLRLALAAQGLTAREIEDLMPPEPGEAPLPELSELYPLGRPHAGGPPQRRAAASEVMAPIGGAASNTWVVAGEKTVSGRPLLANDPHLRLSAPGIWYLAHLALLRPRAGMANAVGATLPGTPLIILGRGDHIAWGFTNTGADVEDVFIEKLNPLNAEEYLTPEGWRPFMVEPIEIKVRGHGVRTLKRRRTRHGPVLPGSFRNLEAMLGPGHVAALAWVALSDDDTTIASGLFDPAVASVTAFIERMRSYVVPMQSMVVADAAGNIGFIAPGRVPVRDRKNRVMGRAPVPGWDSTYDWRGYLPFEALPKLINPPSGAIGTANSRLLAPSDQPFITLDWDPPLRQRRITELVLERGGHDLASMRAAQGDVLSLGAAELKPLLIAAARRARTTNAAVLEQLDAWDANMRSEAVEPLIFMAWMRATMRAVYEKHLGPAFELVFDWRVPALMRLLEGRALGRDWCDDPSTAMRETCDDVVGGALDSALIELEARYGADRTRWTWGRAHVALSRHRPLGLLPRFGALFNIEVESAGGNDTLNRGQMDFREARPFVNRHAASYRAIYDLADLDRSLFMQATGQSGNPFSATYRSFARRWARGEYIEIPTDPRRIAREAAGTWRLVEGR